VTASLTIIVVEQDRERAMMIVDALRLSGEHRVQVIGSGTGLARRVADLRPDLVLIDGRFRVACLMTVLLRIQRPVRVLFDDYADRPKYQRAEALVRPRRMIGRMAEFEVDPGMIRPRDIGFVIGRYFEVTVHHANQKTDYALSPQDMTELNRIASDTQERQADDRQA
jgi:hypothetical protein